MDFLIHELHLEYLVSEIKPVLLSEKKSAATYAILKASAVRKISAKAIIDEYFKRCKDNLLPLSDFCWLDKKSIRQCNFVWAYLCNSGLRPAKSLKNIRNDAKKYQEIISWIDNLPSQAREKIDLMDRIKTEWASTTAYKDFTFKFLKANNQAQCDRALAFLTKALSVKSKPYLKPLLQQGFEVSSSYYQFLLSVDLWRTHPYDKAIFHDKINDAARKWPETKSQRKTRKNKKVTLTPSNNKNANSANELIVGKHKSNKSNLSKIKINSERLREANENHPREPIETRKKRTYVKS